MSPPSSIRQVPLSFPEPRRILVRGVNWLGDAVMTTPALQRLREKFPQSHIALLTHEKLAPLWRFHPSLNDVIVFARGEAPGSIARRLRAEKFDLGLVLPNSPRSALEVWLGRIPCRVGYSRPWRNWFLTQIIAHRPGQTAMRKRSTREIKNLIGGVGSPNPKSPVLQTPESGPVTSQSHQIHEYLHLTSVLGANPEVLPPSLIVHDEELQAVEKRWLVEMRERTEQPISNKPFWWFGLNPSAAYGPAKRWSAENFAGVAHELSRRIGNCGWLVFGGANEQSLCADIAKSAGNNVINVAGKTDLRELMASLKLCRLLLTNDSGPMHVAAALGTPVVVPFGSTAPELTGPGLPGGRGHHLLKSDAPCSPCFRRTCPIDHRCMTGITVEQVVRAVLGVGNL